MFHCVCAWPEQGELCLDIPLCVCMAWTGRAVSWCSIVCVHGPNRESCVLIFHCVSAWPEQGELCLDVPLFLLTGNSADGLHLHISGHTVNLNSLNVTKPMWYVCIYRQNTAIFISSIIGYLLHSAQLHVSAANAGHLQVVQGLIE